MDQFSFERLSTGHEWGPTATPAPALARVAEAVRQSGATGADDWATALETAMTEPEPRRRLRPR